MRKISLLVVAALLLLCGCKLINRKGTAVDCTTPQDSEYTLYKGLLPAADCSGIEYALEIEQNGDSFRLATTYIDAEAAGKNITFNTSGSVTLVDKTYYRLTSNDNQTLYFKIESDTTLLLVNSQLQPPSLPQNYQLVKVER